MCGGYAGLSEGAERSRSGRLFRGGWNGKSVRADALGATPADDTVLLDREVGD